MYIHIIRHIGVALFDTKIPCVFIIRQIFRGLSPRPHYFSTATSHHEEKSNQSYYTHGMIETRIESLFMSLVFLFPLFTEGQMDYKIVFNYYRDGKL